MAPMKLSPGTSLCLGSDSFWITSKYLQLEIDGQSDCLGISLLPFARLLLCLTVTYNVWKGNWFAAKYQPLASSLFRRSQQVAACDNLCKKKREVRISTWMGDCQEILDYRLDWEIGKPIVAKMDGLHGCVVTRNQAWLEGVFASLLLSEVGGIQLLRFIYSILNGGISTDGFKWTLKKTSADRLSTCLLPAS